MDMSTGGCITTRVSHLPHESLGPLRLPAARRAEVKCAVELGVVVVVILAAFVVVAVGRGGGRDLGIPRALAAEGAGVGSEDVARLLGRPGSVVGEVRGVEGECEGRGIARGGRNVAKGTQRAGAPPRAPRQSRRSRPC